MQEVLLLKKYRDRIPSENLLRLFSEP